VAGAAPLSPVQEGPLKKIAVESESELVRHNRKLIAKHEGKRVGAETVDEMSGR
jgi:hypothetical protein